MMLNKKSSNGFTLMEVVVVISIMTILLMMIVPTCVGYFKETKEIVCEVNCLQVKGIYEQQLQLQGKEHSDIIFNNFLLKYSNVICPNKGNVIYVNGEAICEMHGSNKEDDDSDTPIL